MVIRSAEEFIQLRCSSDAELYRRAAFDSASEEVWREVIDTRPDLRLWVVLNKTVPAHLLDELASDEDAAVRAAVARTRRTPADTLRRLALDPDDAVRLAVARNGRAPAAVLRLLLGDSWSEVAAVARGRLGSE